VRRIAVSLDGTTMKYVSLNVEQHCEGGTAALNGKIRYRPALDPASPLSVSVFAVDAAGNVSRPAQRTNL
jgi:hypothetical protein